jgi:WD40 repeat protein
VSKALAATLAFPDKKSWASDVRFSPDSRKLFCSGYPSGVILLWDVATRKQTRRINTPRGYRGDSVYATISPDWKKMYVASDDIKHTQFERDGKKAWRSAHSGGVRVWDLESGKEATPLKASEGCGVFAPALSPDGRVLYGLERPSSESDRPEPEDRKVIWDVATGKKRPLGGGLARATFLPDGKTILLRATDYRTRASSVKRLDLGTGKVVAEWLCPDKERFLSSGPLSPDGKLFAAYMGGKRGAPTETRFLDSTTLKERGRFVGEAEPKGYGWGNGVFTPDGKRYVMLDGVGNAVVWDVARMRRGPVIRYAAAKGWILAISPDSRTLAVAWRPKAEDEDERDADLLPQPRISLIDLDGKRPTRVLIAPHGSPGPVAFSPDGKTLALGSTGAVHLFDLSK